MLSAIPMRAFGGQGTCGSLDLFITVESAQRTERGGVLFKCTEHRHLIVRGGPSGVDCTLTDRL